MNTQHATSRSPRSTRILAAALFVGLVSAASLGPLRAQTTPASRERHAIRFERPQAVGSRYRVEVTGEKTMELRQRGANTPTRSERMMVRFVAVERVLAVDTLGSPTTSEYTIDTFEVQRGEQRTTPLARGTVLTLERATTPTGEARVHVGGTNVAPEVADALGVVVSQKVSGVSDDEVFGSTTPRRVGERWSIASDVAQRELASAGLGDVRLRGDVRAVELATVDQIPCLVLSATMGGRLSGLPDLPGNATFVSGTLATTMRGAFPLDGTTTDLTGEFTMELETSFTVRAGSPAVVQTFEMVVRESRSEHTTPLP